MGEVTMYSWARRVQAEHMEWLRSNYPGQTPLFPAVGMVEEAGELVHALLKREQERKWGSEPRYEGTDWGAQLEDAIGDCALYACSLCNTVHWDFERLLGAVGELPAESPFDGACRLVRIAGGMVTDPADEPMCAMYLACLQGVSRAVGVQFAEAVVRTWEEVKRRSRDSAPRREVVVLCGSSRFRDAFQRAFYEEEHAGRVCLTISCFKDDPCCKDERSHAERDAQHRAKIDMADTVCVLNVGGYIGDSTRAEILYARSRGKHIRYLEPSYDAAGVGEIAC